MLHLVSKEQVKPEEATWTKNGIGYSNSGNYQSTLSILRGTFPIIRALLPILRGTLPIYRSTLPIIRGILPIP